MTVAFIVLLTFMLGPGVAGDKTIQCNDWACVERVVAHSWESSRLSRLRVFKGGSVGLLPHSGQPVFPPLLDLWLS